MSEEKSENEANNLDQLDFSEAIQATRSSVWRLFNYAASDANKDLAQAKPELIKKVVPALHKDPAQLTDTEINELMCAYNDLSLLVFPATNESLWLKEKIEQAERAKVEGRSTSFSPTTKGVNKNYGTFLIILGIVIVFFFAFQAYTYFLSDTLQQVTEQEATLKSIEDQINAARNVNTGDDNLESTFLFTDLLKQKQAIWLELNSSYCMLREASIVWQRWYPEDSIMCDTKHKRVIENWPQECKNEAEAERQKCKENDKKDTSTDKPDEKKLLQECLNKVDVALKTCELDVNKKSREIQTRETEEKAARHSFFEGAKAILRVLNYLILPTLLGLLGALAYVIRGVLESFSRSSFILGARRRWLMRVALGPLLGLISGIVVSPDLSNFKEISFSPLVWAFLMGYSVEFAFSLFDALIEKGRRALGSVSGIAEVADRKAQQNSSISDIQQPISVPRVKSMQPTSGSASGGTEVIITGAGFTGDASVSFGSTPATAINVTNETQITATSPAGKGTVNVSVTSGGITSPNELANQFTYEEAGPDGLVGDEIAAQQLQVATPQVESVQPTSGSTSGGTEVIITGTGFTGDAGVSFGSTPAIAIAATSETQITATSPPGQGTVNVRVRTLGGLSSADAKSQFTYDANDNPVEGGAG